MVAFALRWAVAAAITFPGVISGPALAQDCADPTQMGLDQCAGAAFKKSDARLNQVYGQIAARLSGDAATKAKLVAAQRAWIAFRDAECAFRAAGVEGGSIHSMTVTLCRKDVTDRRVTELEPLLNCEEGDTSCPVPAAQ
ncbi:protein of unknown function DUF1311 [Ancylobacter novellus DSM 506]|uniref:Lysozyme inhibitor LprI-like N-terminal domain-containing protein n=1 Tax=Ancylobacter novellus (strain ATCC 8093 / DSM 506 / JCM 20403 / CCM 1077 / IAM 12100 / NBRC 12443 / NCIMB 10456) TaxID=639283 RepID=D6ZZ65_ANCN5|nr:lysozyme inhibitor LprI family protein [Ancylobacter novellus]ADH89201.1 protein of unknown function DUF1311 [Ancylobacter novellus DSM 506]